MATSKSNQSENGRQQFPLKQIPTPPVPVKAPDLTIKQEELQQLDKMIGEIPTKFGIPLFQFFQLLQQKRMAEKTKEVET